ncbi:MAG: threonine ammonia-lyase [Rhodospirillales bacterium]
MTVTVAEVRTAAALLAGRIVRTPSIAADVGGPAPGTAVVLKLENLQVTGSFKARGAMVKLASLDSAARTAGVVTASAGNHAQGVAYHAGRLGIPATVVMPRGTPFTKVGRTEALGARVVLSGEDLSEARAHAMGLVAAEGGEFVSPYDDERIIAGQGTVALEMLADDPDLECLIVPVGGGGLIAGVAIAAKAVKPTIEIFGVQAALYPTMRDAIRGRPAGTTTAQTLAEGIAVKEPGVLTRPVIEALVADIFLTSERALESAVYSLLHQQKLVVEGAGAAPLAALLENRDRFAGRKVGLVLSGGNIDPMVLSSILLRGLSRDGRLVQLRVEIPDRPGTLAKVTGLIGEAGGNIVEVYHRRLFYDVPVKLAELDVLVETQSPSHVRTLIACLEGAGYATSLLSGTKGRETG